MHKIVKIAKQKPITNLIKHGIFTLQILQPVFTNNIYIIFFHDNKAFSLCFLKEYLLICIY